MRIKLVIFFVGTFLLFLQGSPVFADNSSAQKTISMSGSSTVDSSQRQARLSMTADAADHSGWHLETVLTPISTRGRNQQATTTLSGQFTLVQPDGSKLSGQAQGQIDRYGSGTLKLASTTGTNQSSASFSISNSGLTQVNLVLQSPADAANSTVTADQTQPVNHIFWYLSRATGLTAYLVLFLNVCLGVGLSTRLFGPLLARWRAFDLHQFTGFLALGLTAFHVFVLLGDRYIGMTLDQLLVPFASTYRPFWIALGIIAFYFLIAITISYYVRQQIGLPLWRVLHTTTYVFFLMALVHSVISGTDTGESWASFMYWTTAAVVALLTFWRFISADSERPSNFKKEDPEQVRAA